MSEHLKALVGKTGLRPHIHKYVLRNLASQSVAITPMAPRIVDILTWFDEAGKSTLKGAHTAGQLTLDFPDFDADLPEVNVSRYLSGHLRSMFNEEFHLTVDKLHYQMCLPKFSAIRWFREYYGIEEDDYPELSMIRDYQRYERRQNRAWRKRGRIRRFGLPTRRRGRR